MSSSGQLIKLKNNDFNINFTGDDEFTLEITVVNTDSVSSYAIKVPWSISSGTSTLGSGTIESRVGPGSERDLFVDVNHNLQPGDELFVCVSAEIDSDNVTGL